MTQPIPPITPAPTEVELVELYWACQRRDRQAVDELAAGISLRLGVDDGTPDWLMDLVRNGISAQLAERPGESGQAAAA